MTYHHRVTREVFPERSLTVLEPEGRHGWLLLLAFGITGLGVMIAAGSFGDVTLAGFGRTLALGPLHIPIGVATAVAGAAVAALVVRRWRRVRPVLMVDFRGITHRVSAGFVPWGQVVGGQRVVVVDVVDRAALLAGVGFRARRRLRANRDAIGSPVVIRQAALPVALDEVAAEIRAHLR